MEVLCMEIQVMEGDIDNMKPGNQNQLKNFINEVSFAIDDLVLYLDTHPCDKEALACYQDYRKMRQEALEEYSRCYGPLLDDMVLDKEEWTWALQPAPWKGEC